MRAILTCLAVVALGCGGPAPEPSADPEAHADGPLADPIAIQMGGREVRVGCGVECAEVTGELSRLHAGCMHDPLSTPHQVAEGEALVSLGCCTAVSAGYERACGVEGAARCASEWTARCERGGPREATP